MRVEEPLARGFVVCHPQKVSCLRRECLLPSLSTLDMTVTTQPSHPVAPLTPPVADRIPVSTTLHGDTRVDDYAWLRDKSDARVIAYLNAENAYTDGMMRHTEPLQGELYTEMLGRIKEDDSQVPARHGDWWYYTRTEQGKPYPIFCRRFGAADAPEQVYYDQNAAAVGHDFHNLGGFEVSPDHRFLAVLVDTNGYEDFELQVIDLTAGETLPDRIAPLGFGLAWASASGTLFYTTTDEAKRSNAVHRHRLGTPASEDVRVYVDGDSRFNVGVHTSRSAAWVCISSASFTSAEWWVVDAAAPESAPRCVAPRTEGVEYDIAHGGDWWYITTNRDAASNFKVMRAPVRDPAAWMEWIAHRPEVFVEGVDVFAQHAVVVEREGGLRQLTVIDLASDAQHRVGFDDAAYGVYPADNPEFHSTAYRFSYSSLAQPRAVYDYDLASRTRALRKRDEVLGDFDPSRYTVERVMAPARDGTMVPVSLVYRAPLARDGNRPLLLYAYGSYGYTMEPTFSSVRFSLIDRGFIYAIAHVRGGQEMGRAWYDAGKMQQKVNTFYDFIDVADHLVRERYTSRRYLAANGGSAGGLLMGAIANLRPELFRAIVADVPFVDVLNTMLDESLPLTSQEWEQWGNPNLPADYTYIKSYAPYENVTAQGYPRILATSGVNDSRVPFWEPTKWVARLRALKTDTNPLLLKMNMGAGHGGSTGRYERLKEEAFRQAFIIDQVVGVPDAQ